MGFRAWIQGRRAALREVRYSRRHMREDSEVIQRDGGVA
jgi:hypothetical protein